MRRGHRLVAGVVAFLALPILSAHAQYGGYYPYGQGYAGGGFGGFGGTVFGSNARGLGAFAAGAGTYNYDTSVANSINTNTYMRYNDWVWRGQQAANEREYQHMARRQARVNAAQATAQDVVKRVRENPTESDVDSGAALNAILDQLSTPKMMSGSDLRFANAKIGSKLVRAIPFRNGTDAITITLDQLTEEKNWPASLRDPKFDKERHAYVKAVDAALEEDKNGEISPATVGRVRQSVADLYRRVGELIPVTRQPDHLDAMNYLKGLAGFSKMLEKSNIDQVLAELEKIDSTTVGHLIAFMHTYNLRFGAADTASQKAAYASLYPLMSNTREKLIGKAGDVPLANDAPDVSAGSPTEIFHGIDPKHLYPTPPAPGATTPDTKGGTP